MILDRIENRAFYQSLGPRIGEALRYLAATDFTKMPDGKYDIDGPRIFALVQRYRPKRIEEIVWESHRNYIDVQYMADGAERMGYTALTDQIAIHQAYDAARDVVFYDAGGSLFTIGKGSFAIFTPNDIHAPGLALDREHGPSEVLKVVIKCHV